MVKRNASVAYGRSTNLIDHLFGDRSPDSAS